MSRRSNANNVSSIDALIISKLDNITTSLASMEHILIEVKNEIRR